MLFSTKLANQITAGCAALLLLVIPVVAQPRKPGETRITASKIIYTQKGAILLGSATKPAHIETDELDVRAQRIEFERAGEQVQRVTAQGNVNFKLNLPSKTKGNPPSRIEARSNSGTLEPTKRTLVLTGDVDGWYQMGESGRNTLSGKQVTLTFGQEITAKIEGGAEGVEVVLPAQSVDARSQSSIGSIKITALNAFVDQSKGTARFEGNARAVSTDGAIKFDVAAKDFIATRDPKTGSLNNLNTVGRTATKIDLPPQSKEEPTKSPNTAPKTNPAAPGGAKAAAKNDKANKFLNQPLGRPTHLEIYADVVTVSRPNNLIKVEFKGNVTGSYRMEAEGKTSPDYPLSSIEHVVITETVASKDPKKSDFDVVVEADPDDPNAQVELTGPGLNFKFGD
ncbi:MAG: hypothetical protein M3347_02725 [Armatimonadota bacterium]|nr:hypothetical protein [Armatimonadota bacterium]